MDIEQEIQAKGKTAPRVTPADVQAAIASEHYFTAAEGVYGAEVCRGEQPSMGTPPLLLLTICVLVMRNGFTVLGKSACASPENFDAELGRKIARKDAVDQCWPLMGYALRDKLAARPADFRDRVRLERAELDEKREALAAFFGTATFASLPTAEQERMRAQLDAMRDYSVALMERIDAFGS
jgi:Phage protein (N4 Gp49/phage Sf6 gene 66) family